MQDFLCVNYEADEEMKSVGTSGYIILCCLCGVAVLVATVHANPIESISIQMSIYQNNTPIDDTINFTVKCYGINNNKPSSSPGLLKTWISLEPPRLFILTR